MSFRLLSLSLVPPGHCESDSPKLQHLQDLQQRPLSSWEPPAIDRRSGPLGLGWLGPTGALPPQEVFPPVPLGWLRPVPLGGALLFTSLSIDVRAETWPGGFPCLVLQPPLLSLSKYFPK